MLQDPCRLLFDNKKFITKIDTYILATHKLTQMISMSNAIVSLLLLELSDFNIQICSSGMRGEMKFCNCILYWILFFLPRKHLRNNLNLKVVYHFIYSVLNKILLIFQGSRRRPVRAVLHVSGDGLRVVEEETKGLIVDQTIEKVSFCAPDRNHERGFSYICRDGTTRRWMCHGFLALRESGERLSHAVGCAFAVCLER